MHASDYHSKAITSMSSTTQCHQLDFNAYNHRVSTTQDGHFATSAYDNIIITTQDSRFSTIESNDFIVAGDSVHRTPEQKNSPCNHVESSASIGEYDSAGSSLSRLLDDVMSIDTFPCVLIPLTPEDKIVNWLDIPLEIICIHTKSSIIDNEEVSMSNDFQVDTLTRDASWHLLTPGSTAIHRVGQWHFDIESVDDDDISIDTVKTWSLSEDFS